MPCPHVGGSLTYSESQTLDDKLDKSEKAMVTPRGGDPPSHTSSKQRSLRTSFKLPVVPVEIQEKFKTGYPPVPAPKLLTRMSQKKDPRLESSGLDQESLVSQDPSNDPVVHVMHRRVFKNTKSGLILIEDSREALHFAFLMH